MALSFLALNKISLSEFTVEFIHLPTEGYPGCFQVLTFWKRYNYWDSKKIRGYRSLRVGDEQVEHKGFLGL